MIGGIRPRMIGKIKTEDRQEKERELAGVFFGRFNFAHQGLQGFP